MAEAVAEAEPVAEAEEVKEAAPTAEAIVETVPVAETAPAAPEAPPIPTMDDVKTVLSQFAFEPTVQEIQEVAMRFAEVHPDKIESWRRGARWRAFLPELKLRYTHRTRERKKDKIKWERNERITTTSSLSEWFAGGGPTFSQGLKDDDRLTIKYKPETEHQRQVDNEIRMEMKWKLGDFLYHKDQVYIADEAVEETEYRSEVLEQVTQFYFQRRNFQVDLLLSPPEDLRERIRMEVQLQEMTANLDYLTGGYMTARINEARFGKQAEEEGFMRGLFRR